MHIDIGAYSKTGQGTEGMSSTSWQSWMQLTTSPKDRGLGSGGPTGAPFRGDLAILFGSPYRKSPTFLVSILGPLIYGVSYLRVSLEGPQGPEKGYLGLCFEYSGLHRICYQPLVWALTFLKGLGTMGPCCKGG